MSSCKYNIQLKSHTVAVFELTPPTPYSYYTFSRGLVGTHLWCLVVNYLIMIMIISIEHASGVYI